jgi:hypothetical protein
MGKKICGECGAPRGTPHADSCSGAAYRRSKRTAPARTISGIVRSKLPLKKAELEEGLAMSRSTGREILHTPMDRMPPGMELTPEARAEMIAQLRENAGLEEVAPEEEIIVTTEMEGEPIPAGQFDANLAGLLKKDVE